MNDTFPEGNLTVSGVCSLSSWIGSFVIILFWLVMVMAKHLSYKIDLRTPSSHVLWHCCCYHVCFVLGERKRYLLVKEPSNCLSLFTE